MTDHEPRRLIKLEPPLVTPPAFALDPELQAAEQARKDNFVSAFEEHDDISRACSYAGISRRQFNMWFHADDEFNARIEAIREALNDRVEHTLVDIALDGEMPAGTRVTAARSYLEGNRPDKYGKREAGVSGNVQINIVIGADPAQASPRTIDVKARDSGS